MTRAPDELAEEVAQAARRPGACRTLVLDVDGTLAPIAPVPEAARVPPDTLEALAALVGAGWTVAAVSGRPASQVRAMVPLPGVRVFGCHGLEPERETSERRAVPATLARRVAALAAAAQPLAAGIPGARVEAKPAGIAFHDRAVPRAMLAAWRRRVRRWIATQDLERFEVLRGRRVVELRPRGANKGAVLRRLAPGGAGRTLDASLVALGDDVTDEDLFRALSGRGLAVRVGRSRSATLATRTLASPSSVRRFLKRLVEVAGDARRRPFRSTTASSGRR